MNHFIVNIIIYYIDVYSEKIININNIFLVQLNN